MQRFNLAASGLGLTALVSLAMANAPTTPDDEGPNAQTAALEQFQAEAAEAAGEVQEPAADPEAVLREQYLELMQEKAKLMDQAALEAALAEAQQDIQELAAEELLSEAKAILSRVADEYPTTGAAREATFLIRHLNGTAPPPSTGEFKPL